MLEFLIDNICILCGEHVFVQTVGISMDTNRTSIHDQLFLYSYEPDIMCVHRGEGGCILMDMKNKPSLTLNPFHTIIPSLVTALIAPPPLNLRQKTTADLDLLDSPNYN